MSNLEVKLLIADNTAGSPGGNVGRRQLLRCFFMPDFYSFLPMFLPKLYYNSRTSSI
ncbi:MAG: hypothetical protein ACI81I_000779 [Arcobacteraceae bacterium]